MLLTGTNYKEILMIPIDDIALVQMVKLGFSTKSIANLHDCHISTVTTRLKRIGIEPLDGRKNFIEEVFDNLSTEEKQWLINELEYFENIKDLITKMFKDGYERSKTN